MTLVTSKNTAPVLRRLNPRSLHLRDLSSHAHELYVLITITSLRLHSIDKPASISYPHLNGLLYCLHSVRLWHLCFLVFWLFFDFVNALKCLANFKSTLFKPIYPLSLQQCIISIDWNVVFGRVENVSFYCVPDIIFADPKICWRPPAVVVVLQQQLIVVATQPINLIRDCHFWPSLGD